MTTAMMSVIVLLLNISGHYMSASVPAWSHFAPPLCYYYQIFNQSKAQPNYHYYYYY